MDNLNHISSELNKLNLDGVRCLVRLDLNVPLDPANFSVLNDERLVRVVPTIKLLREKGAILLLLSHLGRPKGKPVPQYSMKVVRERLSELLNTDIIDAKGPVSTETRQIVQNMKQGEIAVLENLRFDAGEEANDTSFAQNLAGLGDFYINEAFGASHRAHASIVKLAQMLPSAAGPLLENEIKQITCVIKTPQQPAVALVGGAKMSDKISQLFNIAQSVTTILLGGGMVAAFLKLSGFNCGGFEVNPDELEKAHKLAQLKNCEIVIPLDFVVLKSFSQDAQSRSVMPSEIETDDLIMDIGNETIKHYTNIISSAKTLIWNGPVGYYEWTAYQKGTVALAKTISKLQTATTIAGGGSTLSVISDLGIGNNLTHVSTGGGAFLKMLEGETLVGYAALQQNKSSFT